MSPLPDTRLINVFSEVKMFHSLPFWISRESFDSAKGRREWDAWICESVRGLQTSLQIVQEHTLCTLPALLSSPAAGRNGLVGKRRPHRSTLCTMAGLGAAIGL